MKAIQLAELLQDIPADADIELRMLLTRTSTGAYRPTTPILVWRLKGSIAGRELMRGQTDA